MQSPTQPMLTTQTMFDADVRQALRNDPRQYAIDQGIITEGSDVEIKLVVNDRHTLHIPLFPEPESDDLTEAQLQDLHAGGVSTVGTAGSLGCVGTACSSASSASSGGSVGSAASYVAP